MKRMILFAILTVLLVSPTSFGAIVYSGSQNVVVPYVPAGGMAPPIPPIDLDGMGTAWDGIHVRFGYVPMAGMGSGAVLDLISMGVSFTGSPLGTLPPLSPFGANLSAGTPIGPGLPWIPFSTVLMFEDQMTGPAGYSSQLNPGQMGVPGGYFGEFNPGNPSGYVGLSSASGYYGWMQVSIEGFGTPGMFATIHDWAYQDTGGHIDAGDTGPAVVPVPGALLLGSMGAGLVGWMRRRRRV